MKSRFSDEAAFSILMDLIFMLIKEIPNYVSRIQYYKGYDAEEETAFSSTISSTVPK